MPLLRPLLLLLCASSGAPFRSYDSHSLDDDGDASSASSAASAGSDTTSRHRHHHHHHRRRSPSFDASDASDDASDSNSFYRHHTVHHRRSGVMRDAADARFRDHHMRNGRSNPAPPWVKSGMAYPDLAPDPGDPENPGNGDKQQYKDPKKPPKWLLLPKMEPPGLPTTPPPPPPQQIPPPPPPVSEYSSPAPGLPPADTQMQFQTTSGMVSSGGGMGGNQMQGYGGPPRFRSVVPMQPNQQFMRNPAMLMQQPGGMGGVGGMGGMGGMGVGGGMRFMQVQ